MIRESLISLLLHASFKFCGPTINSETTDNEGAHNGQKRPVLSEFYSY